MRYHVTTPRPYRDAQFTPAHSFKIKRTVGKQFMLYKNRDVNSLEYFQTCFLKGKLCDKNTNLEKKAKLSESLILLTEAHIATSKITY